jgi:two-component system sensor histidine kinase KdpD
MARELSGALATEQVIAISQRYVEASFGGKAQLLLPDAHDHLQAPHPQPDQPATELTRAQWCFDHPHCIASESEAAASVPGVLYVALKASLRSRGVLVIAAEPPQLAMMTAQRHLLDTVAVLIAIALERVHLAAVASDTLVKMEAERERNTLLAGLSHDLRTPMTALMGLAETLALALSQEQSPYQDSLASIQEQAERMALLVNNLLDMARLQEGRIRLHQDWQSVEELVGSAIRMLKQPLSGHPLRLTLDPNLPLIHCDAVLIERVLINLLQNAAQYTPPGTLIGINAAVQNDGLHIEVWDEGQGLPKTHAQDLFEKFIRGDTTPNLTGVGLGLSICRAIIAAHGGQIQSQNRRAGGACFEFTLPLKPPPLLEIIDDEDVVESA